MATTEQQEDFLDAIHGDPDMPPEDAAFWTEAAARDYLRRAEAAETRLAAVAAACDEIELGIATAGMLGGEEHDIELVRMTVEMVRAALTEGAGENATLDA